MSESKSDQRLCNPLSRAELERRWAAARDAMTGIDALLVQGACNLAGTGGYFRWFTGISAATSYPQTLVFPQDGLMTIVSHGPFDGDTTFDGDDPALPGVGRRLSAPSFPAVDYTGGYDATLVARAIEQGGYRRIGLVGPNTTSFGFATRLMQSVADVTFVDATARIDPLKAVKSAEEIVLIRRAAAMQDEILTKMRDHIRPGRKDFEIMAEAQYLGQLLGSETGYFLGSSGAPGQPTAIRHRREQGREMRAGDVLYLQAENTGPGGYFTHVGRYFVLGKAPQELVDAFGAMVEAQEHTVKLLKPGASCRDIFAEHNAHMRARGFPAETRLHCHGQGYDVVERPLIRNDEDMVLAANMNIGLHPSFANARMFVTVCDNFLIDADGSVERLHKLPYDIVEL
jgi:Xaa-Pro aminopeptidase